MEQYTPTEPPTVQTRHREKVLVLINSDGFVECFAGKFVDIHIAIVPHTTTTAAECVAQEYIELTIPRPYRDVYCPSYRRATEQVRKITPQDIVNRRWDVELLLAILTMGDDRRECRKRWTL